MNIIKISKQKTIIHNGIDLNISYNDLFKIKSEKCIDSIKIMDEIRSKIICDNRKKIIKNI